MSIALLTGASGGLGLAVTDYFLNQGWQVHAAVSGTAGKERLARRFPSSIGDKLSWHIADLSSEDGARDFIASTPDIPKALVHLVGGIKAGTFIEETAIESLDAMINLNVKSTFLIMREVIPAMKRLGGAIVTIGAMAVDRPEARKSVYAASKAAVVSLTRSLAEEYKEHNIRANCILPGIIRTQANLEWGTEEDIEKWTPPEHIAAACFGLCAHEGSGISGSVIPMYGKL